MSNRPVPSKLPGYHGPYFPPQIADLQKCYADWVRHTGGLDTGLLVRAGNGLRNFRHPCTETTVDGYAWPRGLTFKVLRPGGLFAGQAVILFPDCNDMEQRDGTKTDRSIAIYASNGVITEVELGEIAAQLTTCLAGAVRQAQAA